MIVGPPDTSGSPDPSDGAPAVPIAVLGVGRGTPRRRRWTPSALATPVETTGAGTVAAIDGVLAARASSARDGGVADGAADIAIATPITAATTRVRRRRRRRSRRRFGGGRPARLGSLVDGRVAMPSDAPCRRAHRPSGRRSPAPHRCADRAGVAAPQPPRCRGDGRTTVPVVDDGAATPTAAAAAPRMAAPAICADGPCARGVGVDRTGVPDGACALDRAHRAGARRVGVVAGGGLIRVARRRGWAPRCRWARSRARARRAAAPGRTRRRSDSGPRGALAMPFASTAARLRGTSERSDRGDRTALDAPDEVERAVRAARGPRTGVRPASRVCTVAARENTSLRVSGRGSSSNISGGDHGTLMPTADCPEPPSRWPARREPPSSCAPAARPRGSRRCRSR